MKHPDSNNDQANVGPSEADDSATTRELPIKAPRLPFTTLWVMAAQLALLILGVFILWNSLATGVVFILVAVVWFILSADVWRWWGKYHGARLVSSKKIDMITPGTWVVRPGTQYAVIIKQESTGSWNNPTIADGLTQNELEILAPVYIFHETPKDSEVS